MCSQLFLDIVIDLNLRENERRFGNLPLITILGDLHKVRYPLRRGMGYTPFQHYYSNIQLKGVEVVTS